MAIWRAKAAPAVSGTIKGYYIEPRDVRQQTIKRRRVI